MILVKHCNNAIKSGSSKIIYEGSKELILDKIQKLNLIHNPHDNFYYQEKYSSIKIFDIEKYQIFETKLNYYIYMYENKINIDIDINYILKLTGWTIECESPYELRHFDGSFATQQAANILVDYLKENWYDELYYNDKFNNKLK